MYTEEIDWTVTVKPDFVLELLQVTSVFKDGTKIAQNNWRVALAPGDDVTSYPENIQAIAALTWTSEVIADWKAKQEAALAILPN